MSYTPGPWRVEGPEFEICTDEEFIATVNFSFDEKENKVNYANARLIAAAPELLEMLEEAYNHLEYCGWGDSWERACAHELGLPEMIERVIAKAKGESK